MSLPVSLARAAGAASPGLRFTASHRTRVAGLGSPCASLRPGFRSLFTPLKSQTLTFTARGHAGSFGPAYARYRATFGNNLLSNSWRVHREANTHDALLRASEGFGGRMAANAFEEFWPDIKMRVFHKRQ